jgi:hypothetical protein
MVASSSLDHCIGKNRGRRGQQDGHPGAEEKNGEGEARQRGRADEEGGTADRRCEWFAEPGAKGWVCGRTRTHAAKIQKGTRTRRAAMSWRVRRVIRPRAVSQPSDRRTWCGPPGGTR